jgi:hypothetical protein
MDRREMRVSGCQRQIVPPGQSGDPNISKSALVRESVEAALRHRSRRGAASCYDLARDLAGSVKDLPHDLASNPKYMEGFGE